MVARLASCRHVEFAPNASEWAIELWPELYDCSHLSAGSEYVFRGARRARLRSRPGFESIESIVSDVSESTSLGDTSSAAARLAASSWPIPMPSTRRLWMLSPNALHSFSHPFRCSSSSIGCPGLRGGRQMAFFEISQCKTPAPARPSPMSAARIFASNGPSPCLDRSTCV